MIYTFDLMADDYIAMSLSSNKTSSVVRAYVPYAVLPALVLWILAHDVAAVPFLLSSVLATVLFLGILTYYGLSWKKNFANTLARYHEDPKRRLILGPHTLELTDAGLNSSGPLHRSFRAWSSITDVVAVQSHVLFHTSFGVVYVLPLRAVDDPTSLFAALKGKYGLTVTDARHDSTSMRKH